jgi:peptide/nickel transport system substrate-binding protein
MDPHALSTVANNRVLSQVYDTLVGRGEGFKVEPRLALSWTPLDNGAGWRFKLRPNVKFHDGTPFTADDIVFTVDRARGGVSAYKTTLPEVTGARKVDALTVDILTAKPTPVLPLSLINLRIMSGEWARKNGVEKVQDFRAKEDTYASRNANGTGPYKLVRWEADVKTVLVANPDYWGKRGNVAEAEFLVITQAATRLAGLISGEVDLVIDPGVQDVVRLRNQPGIVLTEAVAIGVNFLGFHHTRADLGNGVKGNPLKDVRVRKAIRAAIDLEAIRTKVMRGTGTIGSALYSPAVDGFDPRFNKPPAHDPKAAQALLKEAGYPNGFPVDLDCASLQPSDSLCQAISGMLARVGIKVNYHPLPFNQLVPKVIAGDTALYSLGWNSPSGEPEGALVPLVHSRGEPGVGEYNFGGYSNPKADAAIDRGRREFDPAKRAALFTEAMVAVDEDAGFVPLLYRKNVWAMRKGVRAQATPNDVPDLRYISVDR